MEDENSNDPMIDVESTTASAEEAAGRPWVRPLLLGLGLVAMLDAAKAFGLGARLDDLFNRTRLTAGRSKWLRRSFAWRR